MFVLGVGIPFNLTSRPLVTVQRFHFSTENKKFIRNYEIINEEVIFNIGEILFRNILKPISKHDKLA